MSGLEEQGDLFLTLTHQETQSGFFCGEDFFLKKIVVVRSFTADGNLLQPTEGVNSTFLACIHFNVARDIGSRC